MVKWGRNPASYLALSQSSVLQHLGFNEAISMLCYCILHFDKCCIRDCEETATFGKKSLRVKFAHVRKVHFFFPTTEINAQNVGWKQVCPIKSSNITSRQLTCLISRFRCLEWGNMARRIITTCPIDSNSWDPLSILLPALFTSASSGKYRAGFSDAQLVAAEPTAESKNQR